MIESEGRTESVAPDQPKPELPRSVEWLVKTMTILIRGRRAALLVAGMAYELAQKRAGTRRVCQPCPAADVETARRYAGAVHTTAAQQAMTLPATHGLQLLHGDDLDDALSLIVACGVSTAFVTSEAGGWATTTQRLTELAKDVPTPRVDAALRLLDEHRIELVRRAR